MTKVNNCVSAVIITYNAAKYLPQCFAGVAQVADEIIVCDAYSTDDTAAICKKFGVVYVQRAWAGYANAKNFGAGVAHHDFILSIDADEILSDELIRSINDIKVAGLRGVYSLDRLNNFYGKFMRHSGVYPDVKPRIFDKNLVCWHGDFAHEKLVFEGKAVKLSGKLWHYSINNITDHVERMNKYSDLDAEKLYELGKKSNIFLMITMPFIKFFNNYIIQLGFLDGWSGLVACVIMGYGRFLRYAKLYYMYQKK